MLKWLAGGAAHEHRAAEIVTDDPLATIRVHKVDRPLEIYAVSRVNPIFDEEEDHGKAGSSGYGSNKGNSSSEYSSSGEGQEEGLRDDAVAVLEQNVGFVKSILVAVRGNNARPRSRLSPIPEGKVDYSIPRPVWPKQSAEPAQDSLVDDALLLYTSFTYSPELARPIQPEVLQGLSEALHKSEEALRNLSVSLSHREPLNKMSRALQDERLLRGSTASSSSTSSSGFSDDNSVRNALIYATLCRGGAYEKLLKKGSTPAPQEHDNSVWETYKGAGVTIGDVRLKPADSYYYPSPARPDFTLDRHRAERLMRKIKAAKRRRFWCRLVTSLLGLIFFLMSVMVVSLLVTRGKRVFGPI